MKTNDLAKRLGLGSAPAPISTPATPPEPAPAPRKRVIYREEMPAADPWLDLGGEG